jgi:hypothetical protein
MVSCGNFLAYLNCGCYLWLTDRPFCIVNYSEETVGIVEFVCIPVNKIQIQA